MPLGTQPGYAAFEPQAVQSVGPWEDNGLDRLLASYPAAQTTHATDTPIVFRVRTPNVRMRTRVAVVLTPSPASGIDADTALNTAMLSATPGTLWVAIVQPLNAQALKWLPTRNVVGTKVAPLSIPTDTGLWGYEFEVETAGEELYCSFVPPDTKGGNTAAGEWHAVVNYEAVQRLTPQEWREFRSRYQLNVPNPKVLT